ncbi:MAG: cytochrome b/b6 domain-containing protein [Ignavibacteriae bacterium]|nr:cytochrome b/b6 domain-containing protein [Ignavibacteriota bacterium]
MARREKNYQHPLIVRVTHWMNFIALGIMVTSGLRIYNASPIWEFRIPENLTLGGWLAGARMWHFFGMWLFVLNGIIWVTYNVASKHGRNTTLFRSSDRLGIVPMIKYYLRLSKHHPPTTKYNSLQKLTYTLIPLLALGSVLSGIAIYWPVQFSLIAASFGGYDTARIWHFVFTAAFVLFFFGHLFLVAISGWSNFVSMITGWKRAEEN